MNQKQREMRDTLYKRLMYLERQHDLGNRKGYVVSERMALRWVLHIVEEADAANLIAQLDASHSFDTAAWVRRQEEVEQRERERYARKANRLATLNALNESDEIPGRDALGHLLPGSFEGGKRQ